MKEDKKQTAAIVKEYVDNLDTYRDFSNTIQELLVSLLANKDIAVHSITCRTKDVYKLKQKIKRKKIHGKKYSKINDISDLAGVRIILYFKNDVAQVVRVVEKNFETHRKENFDKTNSIIKTPRHFGYTAIHRIVSLDKTRLHLPEYKRFKNFKCEIQIRSLLQHAWAEIEHDIGYKPQLREQELNRSEIKQVFSETAELLELADKNFIKIRKLHDALLKKYEIKSAKGNLNIPINETSVQVYLEQKKEIAAKTEFEKDILVSNLISVANERGYKTIKEIDQNHTGL